MNLVRRYSNKIRDSSKYCIHITYTQSSLISRIFRKSNYQITEMEQQILKAINHIKYVSKKGVTISGIQRFLKKNLPPSLTKPLWEKLYVKCIKMAKLTANSKS